MISGLEDSFEDDSEFSDEEVCEIVELKYKIMSREEVMNLMKSAIKNVAEVLAVSLTTARLLLQHYHWDVERLLQIYFEQGQEQLYAEANISSNTRGSDEIQHSCEICYDEYTEEKPSREATCGHSVCTECWEGYLNQQIMGEGNVNRIKCPLTCTSFVEDDFVLENIKKDNVVKRYTTLITDSFIELNRKLYECPAPNCTKIIESLDREMIRCHCSYLICLKCGEDWHELIDCKLLSKWRKRIVLEGMKNVKQCPKCNIIVLKDEGCNHMTCEGKNCGHEFCWLCLANWDEHKYYFKCIKKTDHQLKAEADNSRFKKNNDKYKLHRKGLIVDNEMSRSIDGVLKCLKLSDSLKTLILSSVNTLCKSRETLLFTYPIAYFLSDGKCLYMFEQSTSELEVDVETLARFLSTVLDITTHEINATHLYDLIANLNISTWRVKQQVNEIDWESL